MKPYDGGGWQGGLGVDELLDLLHGRADPRGLLERLGRAEQARDHEEQERDEAAEDDLLEVLEE